MSAPHSLMDVNVLSGGSMAKQRVATLTEPCCGSLLQEPLAVGDAIEHAAAFAALGDPARLRLLRPHRDRAGRRGLRVRSRRADREVAADGLAPS